MSLKSRAQPADCRCIQWCGIVSHQIHNEGLCGCIDVVMRLWCALKVRSVPQVNGQGLLSTYNETGSLSLAFCGSLTSASKQVHAPRERERERDTANVIRNLSVVLSRVHLGPLLSSLSLSSCGTLLMPLQERL